MATAAKIFKLYNEKNFTTTVIAAAKEQDARRILRDELSEPSAFDPDVYTATTVGRATSDLPPGVIAAEPVRCGHDECNN